MEKMPKDFYPEDWKEFLEEKLAHYERYYANRPGKCFTKGVRMSSHDKAVEAVQVVGRNYREMIWENKNA